MILGAHENDLILAAIGGLLICIASSLHLVIAGRLTGFASIVFGSVRLEKVNYSKIFLSKISKIINGNYRQFVAQFQLQHQLIFFMEPNKLIVNLQFIVIYLETSLFDPPEKLIGNLNFIGFGISGFLAGFGTKLGNGCTSGHGVCGLPRFSIRSFVAVGCFMCLGLAIATFKHHTPFLNETQSLDMVKDLDFKLQAQIFLAISIVGILLLILLNIKQSNILKNNLTSFIVGVIFSLALILSGMVKRTKVIGFLTISDKWDPSLAVVMAVAVYQINILLFLIISLGNILTFYYIIKIKKFPILNTILDLPLNTTIDWKLILGECLFGLGWGLGGMCPGPAMLLLFFLTPHITACWMICFIIGQQLVPLFLSLILKIRLCFINDFYKIFQDFAIGSLDIDYKEIG